VIVDTSAIVAIWRDEQAAPAVTKALIAAGHVYMSAASYVELGAVVDNRALPERNRSVDTILRAFGVEIVPFTASQATIARDAYRDFGKGSGHRAHLNMGDCFSYALAAETDDELLFVGDDFTYTDVTPAWLPDS